MVAKRFFVLILFFMFVSLFAEVTPGVKTNFMSGYARISESDFWYTSASANLLADSKGSSTVKAYFDAGVSVFSMPETALTTGGYYGEVSLNKVYAKIRLPFFNEKSMRLSVGKMPLSWGYGLYYNSGDIIFGYDPQNLFATDGNTIPFTSVCLKANGESALSLLSGSTTNSSDANSLSNSSLTSSGLSDLRTMTTWLATLSMPFGDSFTLDLVALPPLDATLNSDYGRFGGRIVYQAYSGFLESIEAGCLTQGNVEKTRAYLALDGTILVDYNLCSSILFDTSADDSPFDKDAWNVSLALIKNFTVQTDTAEHVLSFRVESLYFPFAEKLGVFAFATYAPSTNTSIAISTLLNFTDIFACLSSLSFTWTATQGLELSLQGIIDCVNPEDTIAAVVSVGYKY